MEHHDTGERRRSDDKWKEEVSRYISEGNLQRSAINDTLTQINLRTTNVEYMIHGNPNAIDKYARDGMNRRLESIEQTNKDVKDAKKDFLKVAIGSITLAVGAAMMWMFNVLKDAFIHK